MHDPPAPANISTPFVRPPREVYVLFWVFQSVVLLAAAVGYYWLLPHPWWLLASAAWAAQAYVALFWALSIRKRSPEISFILSLTGLFLLWKFACCFVIPMAFVLFSPLTLVQSRQLSPADKLQFSLSDILILMVSTTLLLGSILTLDPLFFSKNAPQVPSLSILNQNFNHGDNPENVVMLCVVFFILEMLLIYFPFAAMWACFRPDYTIERVLILKWGIAIPFSAYYSISSRKPALFLLGEILVLTFASVLITSFLFIRGMGFQLSSHEKHTIRPERPPPDFQFLKEDPTTDESSET